MEPYRLPFVIDRTRVPRILLVNVGEELLRGVTASLLGPGVMATAPPRPLKPGERFEFAVRGHDLARSTVVVMRWLRPNGEEYLWRIAF